ncbi:cupin domain-containing protein [Burkholderia alba]|uniref:hypothetical protein n=1 Tax=Burkholderia alba TaxID=2683677 RepID=UPI002B05E881|nr:hypothetical protein [Burkholderia alba]
MRTIPLATGVAPLTLLDIDQVPRPLVMIEASVAGSTSQRQTHRHRQAQLIGTLDGVIRCGVERGLIGAACCCVLVEPDASPALPGQCCTLAVSPLLRELLLKAAGFPCLSDLDGPEGRLAATLLDELAATPVEDLSCRCRTTGACGTWPACRSPIPPTTHACPNSPGGSAGASAA